MSSGKKIMKGIFKKVIILGSILFATQASACFPPEVPPTKWDYFNNADVVFVGDIYSTTVRDGQNQTETYAKIYAKNELGINLRKETLVIYSDSSPDDCGYDKSFFSKGSIILFGKVDQDGNIYTDKLSGTKTFDTYDDAVVYYAENYADDTCEGSYVGYFYDENSDACFESRVQGCAKRYSDTFLQTRSECEAKFVKNELPNSCNDDVLQCQNGVTLKRVPPSCSFPKCEEYVPPVVEEDPWDGKIICTRDLKRCPDGSYVSRVGSACEFAACPYYAEPETCNNDTKICPDGSTVKRSGAFCNFQECGTVKPVEIGEERCDVLWTGYKYDSEKKLCLEANIRGCQNTLFETKAECEDLNEVGGTEIEDTFTECDLSYVPVCGEINGVEETYTNRCLADQEGATFVGDGTCSQLNSTYTKVITKVVEWFRSLFR